MKPISYTDRWVGRLKWLSVILIVALLTTVGFPAAILPVSSALAAAPYTLTVGSTTGGLVIDPGEGDFPGYAEDETVPLLAVPDAGYQFVNWTGDVSTVDNPNARDTFIVMDGDYFIVMAVRRLPGF